VADGLDGSGAFMQSIAKPGILMVYKKIHKTVAEPVAKTINGNTA